MFEYYCLLLGVVEICFYLKIDFLERDGFYVNIFIYSEYNNCVYVVFILVREVNNEK